MHSVEKAMLPACGANSDSVGTDAKPALKQDSVSNKVFMGLGEGGQIESGPEPYQTSDG